MNISQATKELRTDEYITSNEVASHATKELRTDEYVTRNEGITRR